MVWARFDDKYSESPKIIEAGPLAELLDMRAIIFSCRNETDGLITKAALRRISHGIPAPTKRADKLVEVGRWEVNPAGGWWIHDFLTYNPSKASLEKGREEGRERAAKSKQSRASREANVGFASASGDPRASRAGTGSLKEPDEKEIGAPPPWRESGEKPLDFVRKLKEESA